MAPPMLARVRKSIDSNPTLPHISKVNFDVVEFYSKLLGMWSMLDNYAKVPYCTCGKCECGVSNRITKMFEEERFLIGLNDESFSTIRSQVLGRDPLPSLNDIFNTVQQEEHHKTIMMSREQWGESVMAFAARERSGADVKPTCRHCGKYGHAEAGCYEIIGFPASWGALGRDRGLCRGRGRGGRSGRAAGCESLNSLAAQTEQTMATASAGPERAASVSIPELTADEIQNSSPLSTHLKEDIRNSLV